MRRVSKRARTTRRSSGTVTSTLTYGSRRTGLAFSAPALNAIEPATLNAASDESTSWNEPSYTMTLMSTIG